MSRFFRPFTCWSSIFNILHLTHCDLFPFLTPSFLASTGLDLGASLHWDNSPRKVIQRLFTLPPNHGSGKWSPGRRVWSRMGHFPLPWLREVHLSRQGLRLKLLPFSRTFHLGCKLLFGSTWGQRGDTLWWNLQSQGQSHRQNQFCDSFFRVAKKKVIAPSSVSPINLALSCLQAFVYAIISQVLESNLIFFHVSTIFPCSNPEAHCK